MDDASWCDADDDDVAVDVAVAVDVHVDVGGDDDDDDYDGGDAKEQFSWREAGRLDHRGLGQDNQVKSADLIESL